MDGDRPVWTGICGVEKRRAAGGERAHRATGSWTRAHPSLSWEGVAVMGKKVCMRGWLEDSTGSRRGSRRLPPPAVYGTAGPLYGTTARLYSAPGPLYGTPGPLYGTPASLYSAPGSLYRTPASLYRTTGRLYSAPAAVHGASFRDAYSTSASDNHWPRIAPHRSRAAAPAASSRYASDCGDRIRLTVTLSASSSASSNSSRWPTTSPPSSTTP